MTSIGIIGSGFGAIAVAVELMRNGHGDVRLWERSDDLGGVWRDNTYPGAGCDVPSPLYSYSFAVNRDWSRRYALQPEIHAYLRRVADQEKVTPLIRFGTEVVSAHWDEEAWRWTVGFAGGGTETVDVLVSAVGQLSRPQLPRIEGIDSFHGVSFHSAEWRHDVDLTGKRVAAVGIGASAIQYVPHVALQARELTLFQRTANHILPKPDGPLPRWYRRAIRAERGLWWSLGEQFSRGLDEESRVGRANGAVARWHLNRQVSDPELRRKLTPGHPVGCKRILFSNDFYPAVAQDHVDLVTEPIQRVTTDGIVTADGVEHPADVIIYGTGFDSQDFLASIDVTGVGGTKLATQWADGARAHLGIYVPNFPNLFVSYGPNTNLGGSSIIYMLERQARHMRHVLDHATARGFRRIEPTAEAEQAWDDDVQGRLAHSVWGNCDNWYRHPSGRITSNWPGATSPYAKRVKALDPKEFAWA